MSPFIRLNMPLGIDLCLSVCLLLTFLLSIHLLTFGLFSYLRYYRHYCDEHMDTDVSSPYWFHFFSICPDVGLLDRLTSSAFNFLKSLHSVSTTIVPIYVPSTMCKLCFSSGSANIYLLLSFWQQSFYHVVMIDILLWFWFAFPWRLKMLSNF